MMRQEMSGYSSRFSPVITYNSTNILYVFVLEWSPELNGFLLQFSPRLKLVGKAGAVCRFKDCITTMKDLYEM
jgi:hypothetical protein